MAVVFAAGFAETGTEQGLANAAALEKLGSGPLRILGPNTNLNIFSTWRDDIAGKKLAVVTQSGMQGRPIVQGENLGIAIGSWATIGNEADLEFADFAAYYARQEETGAIAGYVEGFKNGRTLMLAAEVAAQHKTPIIVIKVGRSEQGAKMAQAHTGHLTGSDGVHDAVFEQSGIIRVDDIDELVEISGLFCHSQLLDKGALGGVALYAMSGGTASHVVDLCAANGVEVPRLQERTIEALGEHIPWFLRKDNPVDTGGAITALPAGRAVLEILLEDKNTDILLAPITGVFAGMSDALAKDLIELHKTAKKTIVVVWSSPLRDDDAYRALVASGIPLFHSYSGAVRGIRAYVDFSKFVHAKHPAISALPKKPSLRAEKAKAIITGHAQIDEYKAKQILSLYGIPVLEEVVVTDANEAAKIGVQMGGALVAKILSPDIAHKSDLGLVRLGLRTPKEIEEAVTQILKSAKAQAPRARIEGVVIAPQIDDAVAEVLLGVTHQHPFGPTITYGLGGIFTEVFADVGFLVPPFDEEMVRMIIAITKSARLIAGVRGKPAGDLDALISTVLSLQTVVLELGSIVSEIDINPILVRPNGLGVVAVDALIVPKNEG
jgi:acyl-CoA synthetase (NDP forming)